MFTNTALHTSYIAIFLLLTMSLLYADDCNNFMSCVKISECKSADRSYGKTFFSPRPQDSNSALRLINIAHENHSDTESLTWGFNTSIGFQHSFDQSSDLLGTWFLFNDSSCITIGIPNDSLSFDVDGRQLGLTTIDDQPGQIGTLSLKPIVQTVIGNVGTWFNLNTLHRGLWARVMCTIASEKRDLQVSSITQNAAKSGTYDAGDYSINCSEPSIAYHTVIDAFKGNNTIGDIPALDFGKFPCESQSQTALASIRADLGIDLVQSARGFFNCGACVIAPTGTRPHGEYLFEPVIGANKSWQLGGIISSAYHIQSTSEHSSLSFYMDATLSHLFKAKQTRVFGLINNGPGSQYLLVKEFDVNFGIVPNGERVANILAGEANIGANLMFDASLMAHITYHNAFFDIGYNFWMRGHETIASTICFKNFEKDTYGIKGNFPLSEENPDSGLCVSNLSTASKSTIGQPASADSEIIVLDVCDIDVNTPLHPSACSHKLFGSLGYTTQGNNPSTDFYAVLEGSVEFGQHHRALDLWSIVFNIGFSFA